MSNYDRLMYLITDTLFAIAILFLLAICGVFFGGKK